MRKINFVAFVKKVLCVSKISHTQVQTLFFDPVAKNAFGRLSRADSIAKGVSTIWWPLNRKVSLVLVLARTGEKVFCFYALTINSKMKRLPRALKYDAQNAYHDLLMSEETTRESEPLS
ncbi:MAG: hypothetical protein EOP06_07725 [Proteobacteria bacterium]|nr:MAG: hypothetical protein EOP06_07725 [Pseudomonadota bacterium]